MRSIVYVSLFVACWFTAIGAFRPSLLFRLLDVVPSQVRFVVDWLLCFLIVGIQAKHNSQSTTKRTYEGTTSDSRNNEDPNARSNSSEPKCYK